MKLWLKIIKRWRRWRTVEIIIKRWRLLNGDCPFIEISRTHIPQFQFPTVSRKTSWRKFKQFNGRALLLNAWSHGWRLSNGRDIGDFRFIGICRTHIPQFQFPNVSKKTSWRKFKQFNGRALLFDIWSYGWRLSNGGDIGDCRFIGISTTRIPQIQFPKDSKEISSCKLIN